MNLYYVGGGGTNKNQNNLVILTKLIQRNMNQHNTIYIDQRCV